MLTVEVTKQDFEDGCVAVFDQGHFHSQCCVLALALKRNCNFRTAEVRGDRITVEFDNPELAMVYDHNDVTEDLMYWFDEIGEIDSDARLDLPATFILKERK